MTDFYRKPHRLSAREPKAMRPLIVLTWLFLMVLCPNANSADVGKKLRLHPPEGANDAHAVFWFCDATISDSTIGVNQGTADKTVVPKPHPSAEDWIGVDFDNEGEPYTDPLRIWADFDLNQKNHCRYLLQWTKDGEPIGDGGGFPNGGWNIELPLYVPNTGYVHTITIYNDLEKDVTISNLSAFASMVFTASDQLDTLEFGPPLVSGVVLPAMSSTNINFFTDTAMYGGYIYLSYLAIDDEVDVFGRHPIVPEPATAVLASLGLGGLIAIRRRGRKGVTH